jgi:hypothetical protein
MWGVQSAARLYSSQDSQDKVDSIGSGLLLCFHMHRGMRWSRSGGIGKATSGVSSTASREQT